MIVQESPASRAARTAARSSASAASTPVRARPLNANKAGYRPMAVW